MLFWLRLRAAVFFGIAAVVSFVRYCSDKMLPRHEWFLTNSDIRTNPVGQKTPNPFGLYDLYGNVREPRRPRAQADLIVTPLVRCVRARGFFVRIL
jgi:Sulfatase-modifying factor enzyme 1